MSGVLIGVPVVRSWGVAGFGASTAYDGSKRLGCPVASSTLVRETLRCGELRALRVVGKVWAVSDQSGNDAQAEARARALSEPAILDLLYREYPDEQPMSEFEDLASGEDVPVEREKELLIDVLNQLTHEQPIGWEPDVNDGVRPNFRPFVTAGVLRGKVNVHWKKDRGKNSDGSERHNDLHYTVAEKRAARAAVMSTSAAHGARGQ